ncbi:reverse transcriptase domain-containing protein [Tanacetum coccineum]
MTDAAIKALIAQGVADALAEYEAHKSSGNGDDSHDSGSGRRTECATRDGLRRWNWYSTLATALLRAKSSFLHNDMENTKKDDDDKYYPRSELKKLEIEICNLKVKGTDVVSYTQCFQELALMCGRMFLKESDEVEKYICTFDDRQAKNKRKLDDNSRNNQNQQQPFKRQNVARAYTARHGEKKVYGGSKHLCPKYNYHHDGQCAPKCNNCKKAGHLAHDYRSPAATANKQRSPRVNQRVVTCFECGVQGDYKKDCPKLKNNNRGNQAGNGRATARAYAVGNARKTQTPMLLRVRSS